MEESRRGVPRTTIEEIALGFYEEALNIEGVGIYDKFFEIGGHSLLATRVVSRVRDTFGVDIGVRSIFEDATVEGLASRIEEAMRSGEKNETLPLVRINRDGKGSMKLPLSFAQQRLWFLDQLAPQNPFYNIPGEEKLEGRLDLEALERAINEIIRRHETLRTRFEVEAGEPAQVIDAWEPRRVEVVDLRGLSQEEREAEARRIAREEAETGFDLGRGPLLRVKALQLGDEEHLVLYTMHHIVSDGWSMEILGREVRELYRAYSAGEDSPLDELPIQYADFAVWQREWLQGEALENKLAYWRKQLAGVEALELPADRPRPAVQSYRGAGWRFVLEREVTEKLKRLSHREGATLFMLLMAAFKTVLMRYSGETDVSVGTVIANRTRKELEGLIGFFVNTLVLRTDLGGSPSFRELIRREREVALGAYAHQEAPFEKLVEEINPERDLSRSPLFQIMMLMQNTGKVESEIEGMEQDGGGDEAPLEIETQTARFDLTVVFADAGCHLEGLVNYSSELFEAETINRLMIHYKNLLRGIVEDSERPISELSLLSHQEREQILVTWNQTVRPYPQDQCVHELFHDQAARTPDQIALVFEGQWISYRDLDRRANQLAAYLQSLRVGPEVVVGLCLERSVEMVVTVLGVLKAGGAYLPMDPEYPRERLSFMLKDAGAGLVLTQEALKERAPEFEGQTVYLDLERERIKEANEGDLESGVIPENLAYVIYTSGSTGRPKGVMVAHKGLCNLVGVEKNTFGLGDQSRVLQFASLSFDASVWEIFGALAAGASLHVYPRESLMPGDDLVRVLKEDQITTVTLTPTVLAALDEEELFDLRTVIAAGEACGAEIAERWAKGRDFFDAYGPTEATVCASIGESMEGSVMTPTIGLPIANTQLYILDREMEPVPVGVRGNLHVSGVGLARGYSGRPGLTAERFIPNTFSNEGGERLYRTGDVGRYLSDGRIEFIGRADSQVKIRGLRIEPGEIESVLSEQPGVRQAAVVAREDEQGQKQLVAYVVTDLTVGSVNDYAKSPDFQKTDKSNPVYQELSGQPAAQIVDNLLAREVSIELRRAIEQRLPNYMAPSAIVVLDRLPLTSNGKLDRKALLALRPDRAKAEKDYAGAQTPVEEILVGIYEEVLKVDQLCIYDNFFEIGGHSLLATQVISRVRKTFGIEIRVGSIFETPTVEGLARRIEEAMRAGEKDQAPPLVKAPRDGQGVIRLPLSFAQQRLWFIDQLEPGNTIYNCPGAVRLEGRLNLEALELALNEIVRRHEVLRTRFEVEDGVPMQVIEEWAPRELEVEDLTNLTWEEEESG